MSEPEWVDLGAVNELAQQPVRECNANGKLIALIYKDGAFSALSGRCNHAGGPLGEGRLDGDYIVCPWHHWRFHYRSGEGEPGYEQDKVPTYRLKQESGHLFLDLNSATPRTKQPHPPHPLTRPIIREPGPVRVVGVSTTAMDNRYPRYSTSHALLEFAMQHAQAALGCETRTIRLHDLKFRHCEGYYSKSANACTWPCSITQMDKSDQMEVVYEAFVYWADVILVATPIRWGCASSLYYKMVERMNCIQNQETIANRHLLKNKVASFIITGGQDNVQSVAGQMLGFFAEIGCQFPQFPFVAHSRGWSAEDMENNVRYVQMSKTLREGAEALATRAVETAKLMLSEQAPYQPMARGGRKGNELDVKAQI
jgi:nitrite reductase/ring-hydroxylating ferredoxin subunit/multimeric flavodoxin WrbA